MEQTTLTPTRCFVRELADGQEVNEVFLVRTHSRRQKRNGDEFLKLQLGDMSGVVEGVIWDGVDELAPLCPTGSVVRILGRYSVDERYGAAITIRRMRVAGEHEFDLNELTGRPRSRTTRWSGRSTAWSRRSAGRTCASCSPG
jgi:hypothetical protein